MDDTLADRIAALPAALRDGIDTAAMLTLDLTRQVTELTASVEELEQAQDDLARVLTVAARYLADGDAVFAFPRVKPSSDIEGH